MVTEISGSVFKASWLSPTSALCEEQNLTLKTTCLDQGVENSDLQNSLLASIFLWL